jgi:WhiB family redox-sensing transcriptional regulator
MQRIVPHQAQSGWESRASCRDADSEIFFAPAGIQEHSAKAVCRTCPVRWECLAYALRHRVEHGVWGGLTERERRKVLIRSAPATGSRDSAMRTVG